jgi:electron transfer flavoprotein alpha subunit
MTGNGDRTRIWVFVEHVRGEVERVTLELLGEARRLARETGGVVEAVVLAPAVGAMTEPLARHGADVVRAVEEPRLDRYDPEIFAATVGALCDAHGPALVLFPATTTGSDLATRIALGRGWPLAARCVSFRVRDGRIEMTRPTASEKAHEVVTPAVPGPCFATVAPDVIGVDRPDPARTAELILERLVSPPARRIAAGEVTPGDPRTLDLAEAEIVVAAGRGVGSRENMRLVEELAAALGGSVGGTRVVVDLGWLSRERQIGQTGKSVRPRLYVACGISGATQHTIGMKESATIVAINTDPGAPIFKIADLALQADLSELLPVLAAQCREARGGPRS